MTSGVAAAASSASFLPDGLLADLLAVSLTGVNVLRPLYGANGELDDFALEYLNPAAQRMTGLGERPGGTTRARFPAMFTNGVFAFYRRVFETGEAGRYDLHYQADGFDNYFQVSARRSGDWLVVSFTDTSDQDRSAVEQALRESQAAEQAARQAAERERSLLQALLTQAPVAIGLFQGPELRITAANARMAAIWGRPAEQLIDRPLLEALPELRGQGFDEQLRQVLATQKSITGTETPAQMLRDGQLQTTYYNFVYQPLYDAQGQLLGVVDVASEVTEQVLARQQLERLNEELELRVTARSAETRAALFEAEQQREQLRQQQALLGQILSQVPAAITTLSGPEHRFSFFNAPYQALVAGRATLGRPVAEVLGEVEEQGFIALLDQVYRTGQAFAGTDTAVMLHNRATGQTEQRYVDFAYQPLLDGQQRPQGVLAFVVDVTEKVRARKQADTLQAAMLAVVQRQRAERENVYQLFGQAPAAICLLREPNHRIEYFNPAYQALYPGQALQGHTLAEVQPENTTLVTLFDGVYQDGQTQFQPEVAIRIPQPEGQAPRTRYFDFTYQAYRENDHIAGVFIFGFDVTERVRSRRQVEDTARRLRLLTDALPVLIGYLDRERRYQFTNRAYEAWFGQPAEALLGRPVREVVGEAAYQAAAGYMDRALAGERVAFTARMPYRAGFVRHIHTDYIPDVQQGEVVGFYSLVSDITEQVTIREQLEAQRAELQRLFELAPVAISVYRGEEYLIEFVNPPLAAIFGQVPPHMLGRQLVEFMPDMRRQGLQAMLDEVRRSGEPFVAQELLITVMRHGQPELGYFNFVYQPLPDAQGQRTGVICVATEVTEQVRARQQVQVLNEHLATVNEQVQATNAELHGANHRLTRTNTDLDTFVYTASHDLKAPITNIEGLLEALRADLPPAALQDPLIPRLLNLMQDSVARFQQTIGHLTDISRLQQPEETASVNLVELADSVRLDLAPLMEAAAARLTVDVDECTAVHVAPKTLRSVVYNLLSNAVKYRALDRPAQVQLRAHCVPGQLVLAVQDNGLGLTEAQQAELFGMFRRLHTHVDGSGVGLFMVKRLVENAGGTITVQSQLAVGTTFTVSLPA